MSCVAETLPMAGSSSYFILLLASHLLLTHQDCSHLGIEKGISEKNLTWQVLPHRPRVFSVDVFMSSQGPPVISSDCFIREGYSYPPSDLYSDFILVSQFCREATMSLGCVFWQKPNNSQTMFFLSGLPGILCLIHHQRRPWCLPWSSILCANLLLIFFSLSHTLVFSMPNFTEHIFFHICYYLSPSQEGKK